MPTPRSVGLLVALLFTLFTAVQMYPKASEKKQQQERQIAHGQTSGVLNSPSVPPLEAPTPGNTPRSRASSERAMLPTEPPIYQLKSDSSSDGVLDGSISLSREVCLKGIGQSESDALPRTIRAPQWQGFLFAVITDPMNYDDRVVPMLQTWMTNTLLTVLYFTDTAENRAFAQSRALLEFKDISVAATPSQAENLSVVFLNVPAAVPASPTPPAEEDTQPASKPTAASAGLPASGGAWKNLEMMQHLAAVVVPWLAAPNDSSTSTSNRLSWVVIVDDDTYLLEHATKAVLDAVAPSLEKQEQQQKQVPLYVGHQVEYCTYCKKKKRFDFAFGGNGIFLNAAAVRRIGAVLPRCKPLVPAIAGDERVGFCAKEAGVPLRSIVVGTETMFAALGDNRVVLTEGPFPFAFHRVKRKDWIYDLRLLEERVMHLGPTSPIVCWGDVAHWYLVEHRTKYSNVTLYWPHTFDSNFKAHREYHERMKKAFERKKRKDKKGEY